MNIRACALLVLLAASAAPALAWGPHSHELIAEIAARQLEPAARREVEDLLDDRADSGMRDVATWADKVREKPKYRDTAVQHYVNFPKGSCFFDMRASCRDGRCVIGALNRQISRLADRRLDRAERAEALAFVIHFVADVHQPLHAGRQDDRGGNDFQVRVGRKGMNLHAVWDDFLSLQAHERVREQADKLLATPIEASRLVWNRARPIAWAQESCYVINDGLYPDPPVIDADYIQRMLPVAEERIELAGRRLAVLLNSVLGHP